MFSSLRTDGEIEGITQKGYFQGSAEILIARLFGLERPLGRRDWALATYAGVLAASFLVLSAILIGSSPPAFGAPWVLAALAVSAVLAERQSVRLSSRAEISVSALPIVLAAVIFGPLAALCVSAVSLLPSFGQPYGRWITWTSTRSLAAAAAGAMATVVDGSGPARVFGRVLAAVAVATVIEQVGDLVLGSAAAMLRRMTVREIGRAASTMFLAMPLYIPVAALLVYTYREVSPWSVVLFLFPALVAQKLFSLYQEQRDTAEELAAVLAHQKRAHLSFASAMVATLEARDEYTAGHSTAVAVYARDIAKRMGLTDEGQRLAHLAGLVHDIGKVGLPPGLLEKPGPLTRDERRHMEQHSVIGERILSNVEDYAEIARIVRYHHERVDGMGYPDRLVGEDIPLLSKIIAVADAYDAMTSDRPYRDAMPSRVARMRMAQAVESQFDTSVVAAFEAVLVSASEDYRTGECFGRPTRESASHLRVARGTIAATS
jgi:putative nucleotidyltransferase with HDIG domain